MFATTANLREASRLPVMARAEERISAQEIGVLLVCGAAAAVAVSLLHISLRVPGHAILRAVVPMAAGMALVPRQSAGIVMAAGAMLATAGLQLANVGEIQSAALASLLALGPMLDVALLGAPRGWKLYARFAAAGAGANLLAFLVRFALAAAFARGGGGGGGMGNGTGGGFGRQLAGGHDFLSFWPVALVSFVLCGACAGLLSGAIWFRGRHE
jgi:hypothetical protein